MAIPCRAIHGIAEIKSVNTNPLIIVADGAAIDAQNNSTASLLKTVRGTLNIKSAAAGTKWAPRIPDRSAVHLGTY
jgi:hypothetical protein